MNNSYVFLCGSSSVGKSSLMNAMPANYKGRAIETVKMDFTSIRESLGNPTWEDLQSKPDIGIAQQNAGIGIYENRLTALTALAKNGKTDTIYVFERTPLDVAGYSYAFGLHASHVRSVAIRAAKSLRCLSDSGKVLIVFRPIDPSFPYDRRNNTRPSEEVRNDCNEFLRTETFLFSEHGVDVINSVNQGNDAVNEILQRLD